MELRYTDPRFKRMSLGVYGHGYGSTAMSRGAAGPMARHVPSKFGGTYSPDPTVGWPEFLGGAVAAEDDIKHSPMHAIAIGIATGIGVHIAVRIIDKLMDGLVGKR